MGSGVNEVLSMEERKLRWRMVETARRERAEGRRDVVTNREVEGRRWCWDENEGGRMGGEKVGGKGDTESRGHV